MKVVFFFRPRIKGAHSIEAVFEIIKNNLPKSLETEDYICTTKWRRFHSFFLAFQSQGDVNHITGDIHSIAFFLTKNKTVLTVHDVGRYERDLTGIKKIIKKLIWLYYPLRRVEAITTISEFTKKKLVEITNLAENKITVIPNPAPDDFSYFHKDFEEASPLILQIGGGNNKNIFRLIEAIKGTNFRLLLIRKRDEKVSLLLEKYQIKYEWYTDISREDVYECYKRCDILFFASEYEGFGVPILEANMVGRCVVTSNISSMPDVANNAAVLVDPFSVTAIKEGLLRIKDDKQLRDNLIKDGIENVKRFSKENIAEQYLRVYQKVYNPKSK